MKKTKRKTKGKAKKKTTELTVIKEKEITPLTSTPAQAIMAAVKEGTNLEQLEKVLDLQIRYEANEARKAYANAMAAFKANPPSIVKDKQVKFKAGTGTTSYRHASLANITDQINASLSRHGLSAAWVTSQEKNVSVTCKITHILGHSEQTTLSADPDTSGSKNSIQAIGSTITYLQRYTLLALTGLAAYDQDDNGVAAEPVEEYINDQQLSVIRDHIADKNVDVKRFCKYMNIESVEDMAKSDFDKAITALNAKKVKE